MVRFKRTTAGWFRVNDAGALEPLAQAPWVPTTQATGCGPSALPEPTTHTLLVPAEPTKIVCVGRNYRRHAEELGNEVPAEPLLFLKPPSSLLASEGVVRLPPQSERVEHEAELALVVGQRIGPTDTTEANAKNAIFGYTVANDVTARDLQRRDVQFTRGKGFDTFCVLGPDLVTPQGTPGEHNLRIQLWVNDALRQDGQTASMIWGPVQLVQHIASIMTLEPGDVVLTGTPAGVGPLLDGDRVRIAIEEVGELRHRVAASGR